MTWVHPTSDNDPSGVWDDEYKAWDDDTGTSTYLSIPATSWSGYLELIRAEIWCDKVRAYSRGGNKPGDKIIVEVYYGEAWHEIHNGAFTDNDWTEFPIGSTEQVTQGRVKYYNSFSSSIWFYCHEFEFNETEAPVLYTSGLPPGAMAKVMGFT